jgi:hypothetical protein
LGRADGEVFNNLVKGEHMKTFILVLIVLLVIPTLSSADVLTFKDGKKIEAIYSEIKDGRILYKTKDGVSHNATFDDVETLVDASSYPAPETLHPSLAKESMKKFEKMFYRSIEEAEPIIRAKTREFYQLSAEEQKRSQDKFNADLVKIFKETDIGKYYNNLDEDEDENEKNFIGCYGGNKEFDGILEVLIYYPFYIFADEAKNIGKAPGQESLLPKVKQSMKDFFGKY